MSNSIADLLYGQFLTAILLPTVVSAKSMVRDLCLSGCHLLAQSEMGSSQAAEFIKYKNIVPAENPRVGDKRGSPNAYFVHRLCDNYHMDICYPVTGP